MDGSVCAAKIFNMDHVLGSVNDEPLLETWNGEKMKQLRRIHEQERFQDHPMCAVCDTWADGMPREMIDEERMRRDLDQGVTDPLYGHLKDGVYDR